MAIIDKAKYEEALAFLTATIRENFPTIDVRKGGPFYETVLRPGALGHAVIKEEVDTFRKSQNLKAISENPGAFDDSVVDGYISNLLVTRRTGSKSSGGFKVRVTQNKPYRIRAGEVVTVSPDLHYETEIGYYVEPNPVSSTSLELFQEGTTGIYFFILPVIASEVGSEYSIDQGTQATSSMLGASLVDIVAFNDFSEGKGAETTEDLIPRTKEAVTVRDLVTPKSIRFVLSDVFEYLEDISVIGYGDREMRRDRQALIGSSIGGMVDVYCRTSMAPVTITVQKTTDSLSRFRLDSAGVDVPFFYIKSINLKSDPLKESFDFTLARSYESNIPNQMGNSPIPGRTLEETRTIRARYTIYERAVVTINTPGFANEEIEVQLVIPQNILPIQSYLLDQDERVVCADLLARALTPIFLELDITVIRRITDEPYDLVSAKQDLFDYVNNLPHGSKLAASNLVDILHNRSLLRVKLPIGMTGTLNLPDDTVQNLYGEDTLPVVDNFSLGVTQKTSVYYLTLEDINLVEEIVT